jgi:hypothetical protein
VFDTKRGTLISWCIDQHTFCKWSSCQVTMVRLRCTIALVVPLRMDLRVMERSNHAQHLRNFYANVVYLLVQPLRELSRRSINLCVGPCADPLRFSARFADFSVRSARNSDYSSFRGPACKPLQFRNIVGWAILPVALGRDA